MEYWSQVIRSQRVRKPLLFINIFGLSICIAAALLILLYVRFELSYDSFHDGDHIYRVESRLYEGQILTENWATTTFGHAPAMKREIPGIEKYVRITAQDKEQEVTYLDKQFTESSYRYTEPSFFELFNFPVIKGDKTGQLVRPNTAVLTESAAHRYFGEEDPLGKILTFRTPSTEQYFEVTGVIADMPANSHIHYDFLLSYSTIPEALRDIWYIHGVYTYVRLEPGKNPKDIESAFRLISDKYKTNAFKHKIWEVELIPLKDIHLMPQKSYEKETKGSRTAVNILFWMAIALLLIGWVNALNLTIARFLERGREFGVRKAFGASRKQIIIQGLLEAGLLNAIAVIIGMGWLEVALPMVYSWSGEDFGAAVLYKPFFWGIATIIFMSGTLFIGLYPSVLLTRIRPSDIMRGKLLHSRKGNVIRKTLIVVQFVASFVLITGTFVVIQQVRYMQRETSAMSLKQILVLRYPSFTEDMQIKIESFKKQLEQKTDIRKVSISGAVPGVEVATYFGNRPYGSDPSEAKFIQMFAVDYNYFSIYRPELVCGRYFSETYGDEQNKIVLNETAASLLGFSSPEVALGKQLAMEALHEPLEVVGVVKDFHQQSLSISYKPIIFFLKERISFLVTPYISIAMNGKANARQLAEIEQIYHHFFPSALFSYFYLDDFNDNLYKADRNFGWMFACASLLAVFVTCLGLWVMTLFSTLSRVKEVSIRKVLGATKISLFIVLTRELLVLMLFSAALGIPISAILMIEWLKSYAFHINLPWQVYPIAFILLITVAFFTIVWQVWRVTRLRPMRILRSE